jgi:hypothetical protein
MISLKALISLTTTRLVEYEKEIFENTELKYHYLNHLCARYQWYTKVSSQMGASRMAAMYAINVMGTRWDAAESLIRSDEFSLYMYKTSLRIGRRQLTVRDCTQ